MDGCTELNSRGLDGCFDGWVVMDFVIHVLEAWVCMVAYQVLTYYGRDIAIQGTVGKLGNKRYLLALVPYARCSPRDPPLVPTSFACVR